MSLAELLPAAHALTSEEKRSLIQAMAEDLAKDDPLTFFESGVEFPIWTPYDCYQAAAVLERMLEEQKGKGGP
jgi:hypothetical protein